MDEPRRARAAERARAAPRRRDVNPKASRPMRARAARDDGDGDATTRDENPKASRPVRARAARDDGDGDATTRDARREVFSIARATKATKREARRGEHHQVVRTRGDGRCMFRSLALGLAAIANRTMTSGEEEFEADQLRLAVAESLCRTSEKRENFSEAVTAISYEYGLEQYCRRILEPSFWGGEPELLVIARLIRRPIKVFIHASQAKNAKGGGFVSIQTYGEEFAKEGKRKAIKLLYNGENHYDLLI
jgi:hypothetical protein